MKVKWLASAAILVASVSVGTGAYAQTPAPAATDQPDASDQIADIVVTAQKRLESAQSVPIALTAVPDAMLKDRAIFQQSQLPFLAPSLQQQTVAGLPGVRFAIRGVGIGGASGTSIETSVATVIDDVAIARPFLAIVPFFDLDHIEVLRGPQGMLFGRNASAGLVNIITARPKIGVAEGLARITFGHHDTGAKGNEISVNLAGNVPINDISALRVSAFFTRIDPLVQNILNTGRNLGMDQYGVRAKFLIQPSDRFEIYVSGDYAYSDGLGASLLTRRSDAPGGFFLAQDTLAGIVAGPKNYRLAPDAENYQSFDVGGAQAVISYELGGGATITNILAYREFNQRNGFDNDLLPIDFQNKRDQRRFSNQFSNEIRISSPSGSRFEYQFGAIYSRIRNHDIFDESVNGLPLLAPPPPGLSNRGAITDDNFLGKSLAGFGQLRFAATPKLRLIVGGRVTYDDLWHSIDVTRGANVTSTTAPTSSILTTKNTSLSYRLGVEYSVARDVLTYLTYSRGYKAEAFDQLNRQVLKPEIPRSWELGLKSTLLDRKLQLNIAAFSTVFDNFQSNAFDPGRNIFVALNAGSLKTKGVEIEFNARPAAGLSLTGGITYVDAKYGDFAGLPCYPGQVRGTTKGTCLANNTTEVTGNQLAVSAKWAITLGANYEAPISDKVTGFMGINNYYRSSLNFTPQGDPRAALGAIDIVGLNFGIKDPLDNWRFSIFVRNLFDQRYPAVIQADGLGATAGDNARGGDYLQQFGEDSFRTIGAAIDFRF